jgi:hypothetical protein
MKERTAVPTSLLGIANKALSLAAEASIHEEPGAGKPHAGIYAGLSGNGQSYRAQLFLMPTPEVLSFFATLAGSAVISHSLRSNASFR